MTERDTAASASGADTQASGSHSGERKPEQIRAEIEETREELGETVEAVAAKADVKGQAQAKVEEVKEKAEKAKGVVRELRTQAKESAPESPQEGLRQAQALAKENPKPLAIAGGLLALILLWRLFKS